MNCNNSKILYHGHINNVSCFGPTKTSFKAGKQHLQKVKSTSTSHGLSLGHRFLKKASVRRRWRHQFSPAHLCCQHSHSPQPQPCDGDDWQVIEVCRTLGNLNSSHVTPNLVISSASKLLEHTSKWLYFHIWCFKSDFSFPIPALNCNHPRPKSLDLERCLIPRRVFKHFQFLSAAVHQNPSTPWMLGIRNSKVDMVTATSPCQTSWRFLKWKNHFGMGSQRPIFWLIDWNMFFSKKVQVTLT